MALHRIVALTAALTLALAGCAGAGSEDASGDAKTHLKYGKAQGPYTVLFEDAIIPILEDQGYAFEVVEMSDLVQNDIALTEKEIDFNVEQHTAYAENFNEKQGGQLAVIGEIPTVAASLDDFDYAVITGSIVYNAKIDPSTALLQEDILPHLVLQVAVHEDNKDAKWAKDIVAAYRSDEFKSYLSQHNDGLWWLPESLR